MREIRTYGLMRGRWPVRFARRAGVYSTVKGPISVETQKPPRGTKPLRHELFPTTEAFD